MMQQLFSVGLAASLGLTIATGVGVDSAFALETSRKSQGSEGNPSTLHSLSIPQFTPQSIAQNTLTDLQGYWGQAYVDALANRNYIGGFPDGTFRPNTFITRAQFAAIAAKALNLPAASSSRIFVDVPSSFWGSAAIAAVSNAGLVGGFPDGTFRPNDQITRAQALVILTKALQNTNPDLAGLNRYGDVAAVPDWAKDSIARAANAGIIVNFPSANLIEPNRVSTRGEVAALMYQTLYQLGIGGLPPLGIGLVGGTPPVVGQTPQVPQGPVSLSITELSVTANREILGAGEEIRIRAVGTPKAQGSFTIEGIAQDLPLSEQSSGVYVGSYTVRRSDNQAQARISAKLTLAGAQPVVQEFNRRLTLDAQGPEIQQLVPANLALIPNRQPDISATLSDGLGAGVNPSSVRLYIDGQDVTAQATITPNFIAYRPPQAFASDRVNVEVQAADQVGNASRTTWTFGFGAGNLPNQPTTLLFPQLSNVTNNASIALPLDIVGRTAPNAIVEVKVDAFTSLAGIIGLSQPIVNGQVQADSNGQFSFRLQPGILTPSGTRYRIQLVGIDAQGQRSQQNEVYLVQQ